MHVYLLLVGVALVCYGFFRLAVGARFQKGSVIEIMAAIHIVRLADKIGFSDGSKFDPTQPKNSNHGRLRYGDTVRILGEEGGKCIVETVEGSDLKGLVFKIPYNLVYCGRHIVKVSDEQRRHDQKKWLKPWLEPKND